MNICVGVEAVAVADLYLMINEAWQSNGVWYSSFTGLWWTHDGYDCTVLPISTQQEMHPDIHICDFGYTLYDMHKQGRIFKPF